MSKLSIYENGWINLVFEGKNKSYGAYQLRQQSDRTTFLAFLGGLALLSGISCVYLLSHLLNHQNEPIAVPETLDQIIQIDQYPKPIDLSQEQVKTPIAQKTEPTTHESWSNPEIVHAPQASPTEPVVNTTVTNSAVSSTTDPTQPGTGTASNIPIVDVPDTTIRNTMELDKQPEFPGGIEKFYQFIGRNYKNPDLDEPQMYRIMVSFVIEKDGSMSNIHVLRDPGYGMGQEALRVLESLKTKWAPGLLKGQNVRTSYTLPIVVKIM